MIALGASMLNRQMSNEIKLCVLLAAAIKSFEDKTLNQSSYSLTETTSNVSHHVAPDNTTEILSSLTLQGSQMEHKSKLLLNSQGDKARPVRLDSANLTDLAAMFNTCQWQNDT